MGLKKLFLITVLAAAMSVLGCGDDETSGTGGASATGGSSGTGGSTATGGSDGTMCDFTAQQVCSTCDAEDRIGACETRFGTCLAAPPTSVNPCEVCAAIALEQCGAL